MLVLSRKKGEEIRIGGNIVITVCKIDGNRVAIGITAERAVKVVRGELPTLNRIEEAHSNE